MPSCLRCGRLIHKGKNYCEECARDGELEVRTLFPTMEQSPYGERSSRKNRWILLSIIILFSVLVVAAFIVVQSIPSNPDMRARLQAVSCRSNMKRIQQAINKYRENESECPEPGRIDPEHDLVIYGYLPSALRCPSTRRYYPLLKDGNAVKVSCDSKRKGHSLNGVP